MMIHPSNLSWDNGQRIFVDQKKQPAKKKDLLALLLLLIRGGKDRMKEVSVDLSNGRTIPSWRDEMEASILSLYISAGILVYGAAAGWTTEEAFVVDTLIDRQLGYLNKFEQQLESGDQSLEGAVARAQMYAQSAFAAYQAMIRDQQANSGQELWEMRVLDEGAENCSECPDLAGRWAPIGTLPEIGTQECMANCLCEWAFTDENPENSGEDVSEE